MDESGLRRMLWPRDVPDLKRYGTVGDGGYVVPEASFQTSTALVTFGLSFDWQFEREFSAAHPGAAIHAYDPTIGPWRCISAGFWALLGSVYSRRERRRFLACIDYFRFFREPVRHFRERIGAGADSCSVTRALARSAVADRIALKVDIEGGEYEILDEIAALADRIELLVIEFHTVATCLDPIARFAEAMLRTHDVAHLHANNYVRQVCDGGLSGTTEVTFVRRTVASLPPYPHDLPRPGLDLPNSTKRPDMAIRRAEAP